MSDRMVRVLFAVIWAALLAVLAVACVGLPFAQASDGIKGWWQLVPILAQIAVAGAVGIVVFRYTMRDR